MTIKRSQMWRKTGAVLMAAALVSMTVSSCAAAADDAKMNTGIDLFDAGYSSKDLEGAWDSDNAAIISLQDQGSTVEYKGSSVQGSVAVDGGVITIRDEGIYVLSGSLSDGQILVDAENTDKVQLVFHGVDIACSNNPAVHVLQADKTFITLAEGTKNKVVDGETYVLAEGEDEPDGAIFSKDDLTINGAGSLSVTGNYKDGIVSKDDLVVTAADVTVTAAGDGLRGKDSVAVSAGAVTIKAGSDGIKSTNETEEGKGWISLDAGTVHITSSDDGVQAAAALQVTGGIYRILAGDDGIHTDANLLITGGTIVIPASYEGLEGMTVTITGGDIDVIASDDGINAADGAGSDQIPPEVRGGEPGQRPDNGEINGAEKMGTPVIQSAGEKNNCYIEITGGIIRVNAGGDGIDTNGDLRISGGYITVNGPVGGGDGTLDYDGTATITGGTLIGAGSAGMMQTFNGDSDQPVLAVTYSSVQQADTLIRLKDQNGNVIAEMTTEKQYQSVIVSSPDLKTGNTYTLAGGSKDVTVTLSQANTNVNEDGTENTRQGHMGGRPERLK